MISVEAHSDQIQRPDRAPQGCEDPFRQVVRSALRLDWLPRRDADRRLIEWETLLFFFARLPNLV